VVLVALCVAGVVVWSHRDRFRTFPPASIVPASGVVQSPAPAPTVTFRVVVPPSHRPTVVVTVDPVGNGMCLYPASGIVDVCPVGYHSPRGHVG
jgi:hypothetical protein